MRKISISAFLPAYNEEKNLEKAVENLLRIMKEVCSHFEIIIVNDGSWDKTSEVALDLVKKYPQIVKMVSHRQNKGYGAAVATGIKASRLDWVFLIDADNQFDVKELKKLVKHSVEFDAVVGYRLARRDPWHRRLMGKTWTLGGRALFGLKLKDINCAFKLFKRDLVKDLELKSDGATISIELMARILRQTSKVKEVPVKHFPRQHGQPTGGNFKVITRAFRELLILYRTFNQMK